MRPTDIALCRTAAAGLLAAAVSLALPAAAHATAGTDTVAVQSGYEGKTIVYDGGDHANQVSVDVGATSIVFHDPAAAGLTATAPCVLTNATTVTCPKQTGGSTSDRVINVSVLGHGGDDTLTSTGFGMVTGSVYRPVALTLSGFDGDDVITAAGGLSSILGGDGDDTLTSGPGKTQGLEHFGDKVDGGRGGDVIDIATTSPDKDGVSCDPTGDHSSTDTLVRDAGDIEYSHVVFPNPPIGSGCDAVTIV
ncbi:hypothetical protein ABGB17_31085 [Sphaerisporangium sp. B11E5]|uniref:hypothetical protein n=1 Tax=Sphaerisporangium sp. B11E5 TaxID=3153563 RepID=UPI00325CEB8E